MRIKNIYILGVISNNLFLKITGVQCILYKKNTVVILLTCGGIAITIIGRKISFLAQRLTQGFFLLEGGSFRESVEVPESIFRL